VRPQPWCVVSGPPIPHRSLRINLCNTNNRDRTWQKGTKRFYEVMGVSEDGERSKESTAVPEGPRLKVGIRTAIRRTRKEVDGGTFRE